MCPPDRLPSAETVEISEHSFGVGVAIAQVRRAGAVEDGVEFEQTLAVWARGEVGGRFGPGGSVVAGAQFVEKFAEGVAIGRGCARAFGRDVTFRPHERAR